MCVDRLYVFSANKCFSVIAHACLPFAFFAIKYCYWSPSIWITVLFPVRSTSCTLYIFQPTLFFLWGYGLFFHVLNLLQCRARWKNFELELSPRHSMHHCLGSSYAYPNRMRRNISCRRSAFALDSLAFANFRCFARIPRNQTRPMIRSAGRCHQRNLVVIEFLCALTFCKNKRERKKFVN